MVLFVKRINYFPTLGDKKSIERKSRIISQLWQFVSCKLHEKNDKLSVKTTFLTISNYFFLK